ncbi:MAG: Cof-type HAD-IIB family hydrolase [Clostridiales bacterium]|nr:Cof-type HAD-IIB family hydrolase [Clostridiales bacterium]
MELPIRIIALDLDGTTFTDEKEVTPRTQAAIAAAIEQGIIVMPATGRPINGLPKQFTQIPGVRYALCSNGAVIADLKEQKILYEKTIPRPLVFAVMDLLEGVKGTFELYIQDSGHVDEDTLNHLEEYVPSAPLREYIRKSRTIHPNLREFFKSCPYEVQKINMSYGTIAQKDEIKELITSHFPELICVSGQPTNLELTIQGTDKGEGLLAFGTLLGIEREEIMAFGDSYNDVDMLKKVGVGIAMANAEEKVQACADFVTRYTNNEDGVADVIEQLIAPSCAELYLDASTMDQESTVYEQIASTFQCEFTPNLSGLLTMLCSISQPTEVTLTNFEMLSNKMEEFCEQLFDVFTKASEQNPNISFNIEEVLFLEQ